MPQKLGVGFCFIQPLVGDLAPILFSRRLIVGFIQSNHPADMKVVDVLHPVHLLGGVPAHSLVGQSVKAIGHNVYSRFEVSRHLHSACQPRQVAVFKSKAPCGGAQDQMQGGVQRKKHPRVAIFAGSDFAGPFVVVRNDLYRGSYFVVLFWNPLINLGAWGSNFVV